MKMLFENVDRFEEIPEVYGVFPLRDDFLEAGNRALEKYGVKAEVEDNVVRIPFADRLLSDGADGENAGKDWRMEITACISLNRHPEDGIREVWCEYNVVVPPEEDCGKDYDLYYEPCLKEYDQGYDLIEVFLDRAVNAA
jgi:hypothetical protein